jgi:ATP-dependent DNA ligase
MARREMARSAASMASLISKRCTLANATIRFSLYAFDILAVDGGDLRKTIGPLGPTSQCWC